MKDALFALLDEAIHAERLDLAFVGEAKLALDLHFDPESLAVEALLPAKILAEHGVVAVEEIFVGAAPCVVHAHRAVGGQRAVEEGPLRPTARLGAKAVEGVGLGPEAKNVLLKLDKLRSSGDITKHDRCSLFR